ncbi:MAG: hypothetical protein K2W95_36290 [Candidatus Obscuribacterales bacterium]|nr:hypothetical protein [Candidatus Obscuribacterales bacterium]
MSNELTSTADLLRSQSTFDRYVASPVGQLLHSAAYSAIEAPTDAVLQLGAKAIGTEPAKLGLIPQPKQAEFGSADWYGQTAGSGIGMIVPFLAARQGARFLGRGALAAGENFAYTRASTLTLANSESLKLARPFLEMAATGVIAEGVLRPSDMSKDNFWQQRINNGTTGAVTFTALLGMNKVLKGVDANYISKNTPWAVNTFRHDVTRHVLAGGTAGLVSAETHALMSEGRHATGKELYQSAYTFGVLGGGFRSAGEIAGRAQGTRTVSDVISANENLQGVLKDSPQARQLLLDYGDARTAKPATVTGEAGSLRQAGDLVRTLAVAEAQAEVAAGKTWEQVKNEKVKENPADRTRVEGVFEAAKKDALPEKNWEQSRFAMIRERAFLNDLLNQNGPGERAPTLQQMVTEWNTRWSQKVDPAQELAARMSRTFNANDKDTDGKAEYQAQMKISAAKKAEVVLKNIDPTKHQLLVDIGSAEGPVPHALATATQGRTTAFAVELDPGSFLGMLKARRQSMESGDGSFQAIPVFADGVSLRLPRKSIDAFSSLSNIHELASYPPQYYGQFNTKNAGMALHNWAVSMRDGGRIVIKDFLRPPEQGTVYLVPKEVGTAANPALPTIEGKQIAQEYLGASDGMTPGERWVREFNGEIPWRGQDGPQTIKFQGRDLNIEWVTIDGVRAIKCDAKTAGELMTSSRYGMLEKRTQMEGVTQEQFMNFTVDGWTALLNGASPFGSRLRLIEQSRATKAGSDYVEHRLKFFDLLDSNRDPIDLTGANRNWHTTYEGAFGKAPGYGAGLVNWLGGPARTPIRPFSSVLGGNGLSGSSLSNPGNTIAGESELNNRKQRN